MTIGWLILAGAGLAVLAMSVVFARQPTISTQEAAVFHAINGLPNWLYWPLWLPMQIGNLAVGTAAGLIVALVAGELIVAIGVVLAMIFKLVAERIVRREMSDYLAVRQRPGTSQVDAIRRGGDVPVSGCSFPSGHVILAAAVGTTVAPILPLSWMWIPALVVALVMLGRVYVGAHNPLDVTAGLGAGLLLGGIIASLIE